ncbi:MAG TPA: serine/threonine protein kinase [Candidatus Hydrogenedentes bacterium]|nr:serine/threonine protein kinase [Candidatus Hydrogenedentota bacterium]HIJ73650.1 serine/threonine protein kinase [Candidatus Hydrogenedentota bacterium]
MKKFKRKADKSSQPESETRGPEESSDSELELTHVGQYEIVAPIGTGGMGTVYKAIDRERDQTVAIKVLDRRYDLDKKRRKRDYLGREILIAASLDHENIIKMDKGIIEQEDREGNVRRCLLMEYIDGHNLRKHINERDLTFTQMLDLCIKLCSGLDFLHQNGIVHRDVKPENFLFSRDLSTVKIVDFGLSKSRATWRTRRIKEGGGTRRYMSPEQLAKRKLDARSDIFSFGITMYELLSGRHPCTASDTRQIQRQIRSSRYRFEPPSKYNPEIPKQMDKIILKALRRNPDNRYQSLTEMLLDLSRVSQSRI